MFVTSDLRSDVFVYLSLVLNCLLNKAESKTEKIRKESAASEFKHEQTHSLIIKVIFVLPNN